MDENKYSGIANLKSVALGKVFLNKFFYNLTYNDTDIFFLNYGRGCRKCETCPTNLCHCKENLEQYKNVVRNLDGCNCRTCSCKNKGD